jgi:hypothetical protein
LITGLATGTLMPVEGAGRYTSLAGLSDSIPRSVGPLLAPAVISLGALTPVGGYPLLYVLGGLLALAGGLMIRRVRGSC